MIEKVFTISGQPQAKQRPRKGKGGHFYTPRETVNYEEHVKRAYRKEYGDEMMEGAIGAYILVNLEPPASTSKKDKLLMLMKKKFPTKKPDCDNIAKSVLDALNGVAYKDDSQITTLIVRKIYSVDTNVKVSLYSLNGRKEEL